MAGPSFIPRNSAVHQVKVKLLVNGTEIPVVSASIEYTLNQLPSALVKVPSGVTVSGAPQVLLEPSDLQGRTRASVVIEGVAGTPHPAKARTPLEPSQGGYSTVIFDGYVQSSSVNVSTSGTSTVVSLSGLLSDLDLSSFAAGEFDKNSPSEWFANDSLLTFESGFLPLPLSASAAAQAEQIGLADWWANIVGESMIYRSSLPLERFSGRPAQDSSKAIAALKSIGTRNLVLLQDVRGALPVEAQKDILDMMARIVVTGEGGATAFEKIVSLFSQFGVILSPRVNGAELMPYRSVGSIDEPSGVGKIFPEVFDLGSSSANPVQIPAGAIMYGPGGNLYTFEQNPNNQTVDTSFIGEYLPSFSSNYTGGPFTVLQTPRYLQNGLGGPYQADRSFQNIRARVKPVTGAAASTPPNPNFRPISEIRPLTNALAKQHYFNKAFATKTQDLILGFTTSYAPGQRVEYEYPGKNVSGLSEINTCRGTIESVAYSFSADPAAISTFVRLRHVMNDADLELFGSDAVDDFKTLFDYAYDFKNGIIEP